MFSNCLNAISCTPACCCLGCTCPADGAAGAGLDVTQFDQARADPATAGKAQAAYDAATAAGFGGTPAFVVSGPGGTFPFVDGNVPTADTLTPIASAVSR